MTYPVNTIANHILKEIGEISTLKLHKLVYYCQAWSLTLNKRPLIAEDFQAWNYGPICPELYKLHENKYNLIADDIPPATKQPKQKFKPKDKEIINIILKNYGHMEGHELSSLTHAEDPWVNAWDENSKKEIISHESMRKYYGRF